MSFSPDDYKSPNASNGYMKLQDGENRIRILSKKLINVDLKTLESYIDIFIIDKNIQNLFYRMINDIRYTIEENLYTEL